MLFFAFENSSEATPKLEKVYCKYRYLMYQTAFKILKDSHLAEDAVLEATVRIAKNVNKIDNIDSAQTRNFVVVIARNVAIDIYNKRKKQNSAETRYYERLRTENAAEENEPLNMVLNKDTAERMARAVEVIEPIYRDVFLLRYGKNMSREEIAELCGINVENVKKRLSRAKSKIIKLMEEEGEQ